MIPLGHDRPSPKWEALYTLTKVYPRFLYNWTLNDDFEHSENIRVVLLTPQVKIITIRRLPKLLNLYITVIWKTPVQPQYKICVEGIWNSLVTQFEVKPPSKVIHYKYSTSIYAMSDPDDYSNTSNKSSIQYFDRGCTYHWHIFFF